ncbi:glycoside hydrolase [Salegentibacter salinarum]|uniref:Glycoside hydrolase n=2 Tax=Salegentibacter salinarum TaxID=447422 RepID=A0A2N0TNW0_9FLAO|nr:glycoside hydrolase [Salegentibacter salinarum]SKB64164.1 protein of unknown function [Salegentibacter salinarum]
MNLRLKLFTLAVVVLTFSCKENKENKAEETSQQEETDNQNDQKTYAEISIKKGGNWEGREYIDGEFENVSHVEVPEEHTDHSWYIRYEGPGWENSQVGYRLYLDWRNAIDIFGKKTDTMVLHKVGQDGFDSYHDEADWGMDILKAGKSLGIGSYGRYMNDTVAHFRVVENTVAKVSNSENSSEVKIEYSGWNTGDKTIDLTSTLTIYPEDRFTKAELAPSEAISGLTTGIVKFENIALMQKESENGEWGYIATYGAQTLVNEEDQLGMAIFYKTKEVKEIIEGPHDHLVVFEEQEAPVTYYFLAAWEQEPGGITSKEGFEADLNQKLETLNSEGKLEQ